MTTCRFFFAQVLLVCTLALAARADFTDIYALRGSPSQNLYFLNLSTANDSIVFANYSGGTAATLAMRASDGQLFYVENKTNGILYRWNPLTPATAPVAIGSGIGSGITAALRLTFAQDGTLYYMTDTSMYKLNTTTGAASLFSTITGTGTGGDMAFGPDGTFYIVNNSTLYTAPITGGAATTIGNISGITGSVIGLAFDPNNRMVINTSATPSSYYVVNPATAAATFLANASGGTTTGDLASAPGQRISGRVFEDVNYGGGAGRTRAAAGGIGRPGVRVELYNAVGNFVTFTLTNGSGDYNFAGVSGQNYTVRVVNSTVTSSRAGAGAGLLPVQTYRTNASTGTAVAVTDRVGGETPALADAGNGGTTLAALATSTTTAQSVAPITAGTLVGGTIPNVDFGFNFDTVANVNNAGQGSLRQFIVNANALANVGLAQSGLVAGKDNAVFMISNGTAAAGLRAANNYFAGGIASVAPATPLPVVTDPVVLDAPKQPGWTAPPIIELNGTAASGNGFSISAGASVVRGWVVNRFPGSGLELSGAGGNIIQGSYLGTNATGTGPAGNGVGIRINGSSVNLIGGTAAGEANVIAANSGGGVRVLSGTGNRFPRNSIYGNTGPGIDLGLDGVTGNNGALGGGPNNGMDYPVFTTATLTGGTLSVAGYVGSAAGQAVFANATVEIFRADNTPADQNGEVVLGDGQSLPHGEGRTYLGQLTADSSGNFSGSLTPGSLSVGDSITATATSPGNDTSEFGANFVVTVPGVEVSGTVYADGNHNAQLDAIESGTGLTLFAKLIPAAAPAGPATAVAAVDPATGVFVLTGVSSGSYLIALDTNNDPADVIPTFPAGWIGTEQPDGLRASVVVASTGLPNQNFGLFNGSKVTGSVFSDTGSGGGTANDGVKNGTEAGLANVSVRLTDSGGTVLLDQAVTGGSGQYVLWAPAPSAAVKVIETNPPATISTGASPGTGGGSYDRAADALAFTHIPGTTYTGLDFGDVPQNVFTTDGQQAGQPGTTLVYAHTFIAGSSGTVTFTTASAPSPADGPAWSNVLHRDLNANGVLDAGEPVLSGPVTIAAGETIAILIKEYIPADATLNSQDSITVTAAFTYTGASPALADSLTRADLTIVGEAGTAGLKLTKSVDQPTARPGETITYTITYTNNSPGPLRDVVIYDTTPAFSTFLGASNGPLPDSLTGVAIDQPALGDEGTVRWTFTGTLAPGSTGTVTLAVKIAN